MFNAMVMGAILLITIIILSTAFGKGVVANAMTVFGGANPEYLGEEFSLLATTVQCAPGYMEAGIILNTARHIKISYNSENSDYELDVNSKIKPILRFTDISPTESNDDFIGLILFKKTLEKVLYIEADTA